MLNSRTDRSVVGEWWWTVDRYLLACILLLMSFGLLISLSASPPVSERLGLSTFHFVKKHFIFLIPAVAALFITSFLEPKVLRRFMLLMAVVGLIFMVATLAFGAEIKGSRRWLNFGLFSLQSSEIVKPAFVLISAWLFSEHMRRSDMPAHYFAILLYFIFVVLLMLQPDFGQTVLVTIVWGIMFFMAGLPWIWILILSFLGLGAVVTAYATIPHVAKRIDRFINPESGDTFQVDIAMETFAKGGFFGRGPGEGTMKHILPDAHSDFVFAVVAEEFGILACLALAGFFAFIVFRCLKYALNEKDQFIKLALIGLVSLFGLQAIINMGVSLSLLPAKGMTLPFISYGGSSLVSSGFTMGLVLSLTRKRPEKSSSVIAGNKTI